MTLPFEKEIIKGKDGKNYVQIKILEEDWPWFEDEIVELYQQKEQTMKALEEAKQLIEDIKAGRAKPQTLKEFLEEFKNEEE